MEGKRGTKRKLSEDNCCEQMTRSTKIRRLSNNNSLELDQSIEIHNGPTDGDNIEHDNVSSQSRNTGSGQACKHCRKDVEESGSGVPTRNVVCVLTSSTETA